MKSFDYISLYFLVIVLCIVGVNIGYRLYF